MGDGDTGDVHRLLDRRPLAIGHRGAAALAPENTLQAIAAGVEAGADLVEVDVVALADGTIVLHHARGPARENGFRPSRPERLRLAELRRVVPELATLDEALAFLRERSPQTGIHLDVKKPGYESELAHVIRRHRLPTSVIVSSCSAASLRRLGRLEPGLTLARTYPCDRLGLVGRSPLRPAAAGGAALARRLLPLRVESLLRAARARVACLHHSVVSPAVVSRCHAQGVAVLAWTVNDERTLKRVLGAGVDGVVMDDPRLLRGTLAP
ncbi:MAG: hypothetical protein C4306_09240 [Thermoleophilia bacterium]